MLSYFPTMKMTSKCENETDDMYNVNAHVVNNCRMAVLQGLGAIIDSRSSNKTEPIGIADFGTADGRASFSLIKEMIGIIQRDMGEEQSIVVYYNDQPLNDFNLLSKVLQGDEHTPGVLDISNVFPMIIPRTMYEQCLPDRSLDLAISSVATHYLSKKTCGIKNGVFPIEGNDVEQKMIKEQGKSDWRVFVTSRGKELKPGGFLVTINLSIDDYENQPMNVYNGVIVLGSLVSDMVKESKITQDEYLAMNMHIHYQRKATDFQEPFTSDVPEIKELGLEIVSVKTFKHYLKHPTFNIENKDKKEKLEYSRAIVAAIRPWMYHTLYDGLACSRSEDEKEDIINNYFNRLQKYAYNHSDHKPYVFYTEVVIRKCKP